MKPPFIGPQSTAYDKEHVHWGQLERDWFEIEDKFNGLVGRVNNIISVVNTALFGGTPTNSAPGDVASAGTGSIGSRTDHLHGRESFGGAGVSAVADTTNAGASASPSRSDHRHGRESFGNVVATTVFGLASSNGTAATLARSDHAHGTPPGGTNVAVSDEGTTIGTFATLNFVGSGVAAVASGTTATITVTSTVNNTVLVSDEGTTKGTFDTLNFVGIGVTAAASGTTATVTIPGAVSAANADRKALNTGNITTNSTAWATISTALDIVLAAQTSDWIEAGANVAWSNEANFGRIDFVSVVGTSFVSWAADAAQNNAYSGLNGMLGNTGIFTGGTGSIIRKLTAGEVSGGNVTMRIQFRTDTTVNKTLFASTANPLAFWARNIGP